jgi:hypothetical protein
MPKYLLESNSMRAQTPRLGFTFCSPCNVSVNLFFEIKYDYTVYTYENSMVSLRMVKSPR